MPTTTVKSIGSGGGRDYSTIQAWEDACPANLVTNDEIWKGELYNDSEFLITGSTTLCHFLGTTVDSTRYQWLTTASGQSFADHADKATWNLRYDQSKGVGIRATGNYNIGFYPQNGNVLIEKLQMYWDTTYGSAYYHMVHEGQSTLKNCLVDTRRNGTYEMRGQNLVNTAVVMRNTGGSAIGTGSSTYFINSTVVRPSDVTASGDGFGPVFGAYGLVRNCAVFGFTNAFGGTIASYTSGSGYNASDASSANIPGSNNQGSLTFSDQFENVTDSTRDWRPKSTGALRNNGTRDQTYTDDLDIIGATRSTTTPTIGAREYINPYTGHKFMGFSGKRVRTHDGKALRIV